MFYVYTLSYISPSQQQACRDENKAHAAVEQINQYVGSQAEPNNDHNNDDNNNSPSLGKAEAMKLDLASLK